MQTFSCAKVTKIMGAPAKVCGLIYYTFRLFVLCKIENEKTKEYIALATCILPERMLDWFNLRDVRLTENNSKTSVHIYLDENEKTPEEYKVNWGCYARCCSTHCFSICQGEV